MSVAPLFPVGNVLYCHCTGCGKNKPLKYHYQVHDEMLVWCSQCVQEGKNVIPEAKRKCVICAKECKEMKYHDGVDYPAMVNSPSMHKLACSYACVREIQKKNREADPEFDEPIFIRCQLCGEAQKEMQRCARCKVVHYCSRACQRKDWPAHKQKCG